jgi:hypothetical protein
MIHNAIEVNWQKKYVLTNTNIKLDHFRATEENSFNNETT